MNHSTQTARLPKPSKPFKFVTEGVISYIDSNRLVIKDLNKNVEVFSYILQKELVDFDVRVASNEIKTYLLSSSAIDVLDSTGRSKEIRLDGTILRLSDSKINNLLLVVTSNGVFSVDALTDNIQPIQIPNGYENHSLAFFNPNELVFRNEKTITIVQRSNSNSPMKHEFTSDITALDIKIDDLGQLNQIAVGLKNGSIMLLNRAKGKYLRSDMRWHSGAVNCLAFSNYTNKLLSGGKEGVLVIWDTQTGTRDYLPRFDAPITNITSSTNDEHIGISLADSQIRVIRTENFDTILRIVPLYDSLFKLKSDLNKLQYIYKGEADKYQYLRSIDSQLKSDIFSFNPSTRNIMDKSSNYEVKLIDNTADGRFICSYEFFKKRDLIIFDKLRFFYFDDKANDISLINTIDNPNQLEEIDFICSYFDENLEGDLIRVLFRSHISIYC